MKINISRATGYHHGRRLQRMTQDSSIRNTNRTDVGMGIAGLIGLSLPVIVFAAIFWR